MTAFRRKRDRPEWETTQCIYVFIWRRAVILGFFSHRKVCRGDLTSCVEDSLSPEHLVRLHAAPQSISPGITSFLEQNQCLSISPILTSNRYRSKSGMMSGIVPDLAVRWPVVRFTLLFRIQLPELKRVFWFRSDRTRILKIRYSTVDCASLVISRVCDMEKIVDKSYQESTAAKWYNMKLIERG